jgi:hypothetical protein
MGGIAMMHHHLDRRLVLLAFGSTSNVVVLGIVVLAVLSRPIPQVLEMLAITLASQLGGAMIALGFRPTDPPKLDSLPKHD